MFLQSVGSTAVQIPQFSQGNNVKKPKKNVVVKSHTRNARKTKRPTNISSNIIKVGTIVSRSFKTWPRSRKPGDPPVPEIFRGMVTEIDPKTKKVHVLFENSQNMRFDVSDLLPLICKKQGSVEEKIPAYLKNIRSMHDTEVSDLDSTVGKNEQDHDMDTATVSYHSDDDVVYLKTKEVPDVTLIKVIPGDKPYVEENELNAGEESTNSNTITLMWVLVTI